jgi:hypothetical protein
MGCRVGRLIAYAMGSAWSSASVIVVIVYDMPELDCHGPRTSGLATGI